MVWFSCGFEVWGKVQKVGFRKHTSARAEKVGVGGWVKNSASGESVCGELESASAETLATMVTWLQKTGAPKSRIDRFAFSEVAMSGECRFRSKFEIRQ
jgi:acylphosphatase